MPKKKKEKKKSIDDFIEFLPEGFRDTWERMPEEMKDYFVKAAEESATPEEFVSRIMVGSCPQCGSTETVSCEEVDKIEDPTIGQCRECGFLWCLECEAPVSPDQECRHWDVCRECDAPKNEVGDCEQVPSECEPMKQWLGTHPAPAVEIVCSWCGKRIPEEREHFVFGAKVRDRALLKKHRRGIFELPLSAPKKKVPAIVPAENSRADKEGNDLLFITCSEDCAESLSDALEVEKEIARIITGKSTGEG